MSESTLITELLEYRHQFDMRKIPSSVFFAALSDIVRRAERIGCLPAINRYVEAWIDDSRRNISAILRVHDGT